MPSQPDNGEYYCGLCKRSFASAENLWGHLRRSAHAREVRYQKNQARRQAIREAREALKKGAP